MDGGVYDEDYFVRGQETGKSLYTAYSWKPELTRPMCQAIARHLPIDFGDTILDFGCARGFVVRAFREMGYAAYGIDCSAWAVANADEMAFPHVCCRETPGQKYDWIIAKDVLEHVPDLEGCVGGLTESAAVGVFVVVPLSYADGEPYAVPDYEKDVTHIHRLTLESWAGMFMRPGWSVDARYRLPGCKDNYSHHERGNGFITARRLA